MAEVNVGRAVVDILKAEGVRFVFGLPGGHVIDIYDALSATPEIRHILVRHEQAAASMAAAHAQLTGQPAVCLVTAGPGATNLLSGIAEAYVGSLPIVVLAGRGSSATSHKGASQEVSTDKIFAPVTKWAIRADRPDVLIDLVRRAFVVARNGKPGPVLIDIPKDLLAGTIPSPGAFPASAVVRSAGDPERIRQVAAQFRKANNPIIIAGGGTVAAGAFAELAECARLMTAPVLTTLAGRGSIPDDHPLSVGGLGAHRNELSKRLLLEADFILGLGTRLEEMETNWREDFVPSPQACYVQVDIDAAEMSRSIPAQLPVAGDVRLVLRQLVDVLSADGSLPPGPRWQEHPRVRALQEEVRRVEAGIWALADGTEDGLMSPLAVIRAVREAFPRETTVALDVGKLTQQLAGAFPIFRVFEPRSLIVPSSFYGMGFAAAGFPVAKLIYPDRPAVCFVGDGSFQMIMNVLPMAAEERLGVTWCILDDRALGSIRDIQEFSKGNRIFATEFQVQPDFAKVAEACSCYGQQVDKEPELAPALQRAREANAQGIPAVLDCRVSRQRLAQTREHYGFYPKQ